MFDIGWTELLVLGSIALIVVGPKDLPGMLRSFGQFVGKARGMAREFQRSMDEAAREADVSELRDVQKSMTDWNRKIGGDAPRKYAESFLSGDDDKSSTKTEPGSLDAADEAEAKAFEAQQATKAEAASATADATPAEPEAESRLDAVNRGARELEAQARGDDETPEAKRA